VIEQSRGSVWSVSRCGPFPPCISARFSARTTGTPYWSSQWKEEAVSGYTRIKNRWQGSYIHTENATGYAQYGAVPSTYWTSQWTFEPAA
jgi:hypothetical protein